MVLMIIAQVAQEEMSHLGSDGINGPLTKLHDRHKVSRNTSNARAEEDKFTHIGKILSNQPEMSSIILSIIGCMSPF